MLHEAELVKLFPSKRFTHLKTCIAKMLQFQLFAEMLKNVLAVQKILHACSWQSHYKFSGNFVLLTRRDKLTHLGIQESPTGTHDIFFSSASLHYVLHTTPHRLPDWNYIYMLTISCTVCASSYIYMLLGVQYMYMYSM